MEWEGQVKKVLGLTPAGWLFDQAYAVIDGAETVAVLAYDCVQTVAPKPHPSSATGWLSPLDVDAVFISVVPSWYSARRTTSGGRQPLPHWVRLWPDPATGHTPRPSYEGALTRQLSRLHCFVALQGRTC